MTPEEPQTGAWEQFLIGKRTMLSAFREAKAHSKTLPVQTHHGNVAEAAFRDWLSSFLPRRYGVTAGFIRGQSPKTPFNCGHFDVIVYDQLNAPVLWIESNRDKSESGRARIIPAEHVAAVIEVKSQLTAQTMKDAAGKLRELEPLMAELDPAGNPYPAFLPRNTFLAAVFFELQTSHARDFSVMTEVRELAGLARPFYGAVILSGQGRPEDDTGLTILLSAKQPQPPIEHPEGLLAHIYSPGTVEIDGLYLSGLLMWSPIQFSQFAFDMVAVMNGTYRPGFMSSFHGLDFSKFNT